MCHKCLQSPMTASYETHGPANAGTRVLDLARTGALLRTRDARAHGVHAETVARMARPESLNGLVRDDIDCPGDVTETPRSRPGVRCGSKGREQSCRRGVTPGSCTGGCTWSGVAQRTSTAALPRRAGQAGNEGMS
jgi:hypothetical protein